MYWIHNSEDLIGKTSAAFSIIPKSSANAPIIKAKSYRLIIPEFDQWNIWLLGSKSSDLSIIFQHTFASSFAFVGHPIWS